MPTDLHRAPKATTTPQQAPALDQISIQFIDNGILVTLDPHNPIDGGPVEPMRPRRYSFSDPKEVMSFVSKAMLGEDITDFGDGEEEADEPTADETDGHEPEPQTTEK